MTLRVAMASVCHVPGFVMETMTVEIAQMKRQSNVVRITLCVCVCVFFFSESQNNEQCFHFED